MSLCPCSGFAVWSKSATADIALAVAILTIDADLYFAYGSNLDPEDWTAFCLARGFDPGVLRPLGPGILSDERLVFDYRSIRREGGVLNIRHDPGGAVEGFLFAVPRDGWAALDTKEGHPHRYRREIVTVRDPVGRTVSAWTYRVLASLCTGFVEPSSAYLAVCRAGRMRRGLDGEALERAARQHP